MEGAAGKLDWGQLKDQLADAAEFVLSDIREKWKTANGGPSMIEAFKAFAAAVDWTVRGTAISITTRSLCHLSGVLR
jgi:hypothetical protein